MERNRNKVEVNEDMIKDIMAGDIPVFGKGKQTKSVADRTTSDPAEPDTKTKAENLYPVKKHLHVLKNVRMRVTTTAHCIYHRGM